MNYWLVKTEPETYSWEDLVRDGTTHWNGVRNYGARNNLQAMKKGDLVFVYHSVKEKQIVGRAQVVKEAYTEEGNWMQVDIASIRAMKRPITLAEIKAQKELRNMVLVKNSRLSVQPVSEQEWKVIEKMEKKSPAY